MNKIAVRFVIIALLGFAGLLSAQAPMTNYCMQPPFSARALPPNIMVLMDTSGSMTQRADVNPFTPLDVSGAAASPNNAGVNYFGYFDQTYWYTYNSGVGRFEPRVPKAGNPKQTTDWDGNFLDWATMKRMDEVKKVLIGGKTAGRTGPTYELMGEWQDCCGGCGANNCMIPVGGSNQPISNAGNLIDQTQSGASLTATSIAAFHGQTKTSSYGCEGVVAGSATVATAAWTLTGTAAPHLENITACVQVSLVGPTSSSILKPFGTANPGSANVLAFVNSQGPGTYSLSVQESDTLAGCTDTLATVAVSGMTLNITAGIIPTTASLTFHLTGGTSATQSILQKIGSCSTTGYNVRVLTNTEPTGVIQQNAGQVRWGLEFYGTVFGKSGGMVIQPVLSTNKTSGLSCLNSNGSANANGGYISCIEALAPANGTPIGACLWSGFGYFAQSSSTTGLLGSGGPGPLYDPANYQVRCDWDPYNFNAQGGADTVCANKVMVPCAKSYMLTVTDGEPNGESVPASMCAGLYSTWAGGCGGSDPCVQSGAGTVASPFVSACAMDNVALWGRVKLESAPYGDRDLRADLTGNQYITQYFVLAAFGASGGDVLDTSARNGGFKDSDNSFTPNITTEYDLVPPSFNAGTGVSGADNYFKANDGNELNAAFTTAIQAILKEAGSASATSFIGAGKGQGANLLQAFFYPEKTIGNIDITWVGFLQNLWFQVDPLLRFTDIRDDSGGASPPDSRLDATTDKIIAFQFDPNVGQVTVRRWADANGDGYADTPASPLVPDLNLDQLTPIWEAGKQLFSATPASRTMFTYLGSTNGSTYPNTTTAFTTANANAMFSPTNFLQAASTAEATNIINYIRGTDDACCSNNPQNCTAANYRCRTTTLSGVTNTWKLGDIIDSTAQIQGAFPLNNYHRVYHDTTYAAYTETTSPTPNPYNNRNFIYAGANDGALHAFYMGNLVAGTNNTTDIVDLNDNGKTRGKEQWAFIPQGALAYLRYLGDPKYCHLYYVDNPPIVVDASIDIPSKTSYADNAKTVNTWRTVVIGSMGMGGGCGCTTANCIQRATTQGLSSYFALDVTDPSNPVFLWEFNDPAMGFSTAQPGIVRINSAGDPLGTKFNGHWYVVIGSGPTGYLDTLGHEFYGNSDQNLKFWVLDLKTGKLQTTLSPNPAITNAYAGNLSGVTDTDHNYSDEAIYVGYDTLNPSATTCATNADCVSPQTCGAGQCSCTTSANCKAGQTCVSNKCATWNQGGVLRLLTNEDITATNWKVVPLIQGIGPVSTKITSIVAPDQNLANVNDVWVYFGTGRYFYKDISGNIDDSDTQRSLYGFMDPCFNTATQKLNFACNTIVNPASPPTALKDVSTNATTNPLPAGFIGWFLNLDQSSGLDKAERVITDPDISTLGAVFFTTFEPSADPCTFGGKTFIWAIKYDTGSSAAGYLVGQALTQTSTGQVEQITLQSAFTTRTANVGGNPESHGRRTTSFLGQPPRIGALVVLTPPPMQKILRIKEQ